MLTRKKKRKNMMSGPSLFFSFQGQAQSQVFVSCLCTRSVLVVYSHMVPAFRPLKLALFFLFLSISRWIWIDGEYIYSGYIIFRLLNWRVLFNCLEYELVELSILGSWAIEHNTFKHLTKKKWVPEK